MRGRKESLHLHNPLSLSLSLIRLKTILDPADHGLILKLLLMNNLLETFRLGSHPNTKTTQRQKKGNKELARKQDENGKVLEERHLIDLICDTGENGDEINEPLIIEASRNEFKALCGVLRGIGDGEAWLKLCLRVQIEYLSEKEKTWKPMSLFSLAYSDDFFGECVTVRLLRRDLFYPLYFWTLHELSEGRLTP